MRYEILVAIAAAVFPAAAQGQSGHFVFDLGLTGQGSFGDNALFLRDSSFTSASGIRSVMDFNRSQGLTASFKLMSDATGVLDFAGVGGPWSNVTAPTATYPVLQHIEAGISRDESGTTYYAEGAPANWATAPLSTAFRNAFLNATTKENAVDVSVTLGRSTGAKIEWSVGGGGTTVEFDTIGQVAGTNWGGANVVSSTDPVRLFFGGVGNGTSHRAAIIDDIIVKNSDSAVVFQEDWQTGSIAPAKWISESLGSGSDYLTADDFEIEGLPQQQYSLNAVYNNAQIDRVDVAGSVGYVIQPTGNITSDRGWIWIAPLWLALPSAHGSYIARDYVQSLLDEGYHVAGFDVGVSAGSPLGADLFSQFHDFVVEDYELAEKSRMLAVSNGGLITYGYAFRYPEQVDRIAGIYPALDFTSWPGINLVVGPSAFTPTGLAYDLTLTEMLAQIEQYNPIDNLAPLAAAGIPLWHIHGDADTVVPIGPNSNEALQRYLALGGDIQLKVVPGGIHGGTEFFTDSDLLDFLIGPSAVGLPGDFDGNNVVDGADFLLWQRGESPNPLSASELADWQLHYGNNLAGEGTLTAQVPEPSSLVLLTLASCGLYFTLSLDERRIKML